MYVADAEQHVGRGRLLNQVTSLRLGRRHWAWPVLTDT